MTHDMEGTGMKYGYTRVSTRDKQHDDLQRRALLEAGVAETRIFSDKLSGSRATATRPGWSDLEVRLRRDDELVVWRIDRIGRSMIDVITTVDELLERGIRVRSLTDGIDPSTRQGRLMLGLMATFAEYERELIRDRVQNGVDAARARGVRFGRPAVDPEETARKVRTVKHLVENEGLTVRAASSEVGWSRATYYRHWFASEFVSHFPGVITQHLAGPPVTTGGSDHVRERRAGQASQEAVSLAVAEV